MNKKDLASILDAIPAPVLFIDAEHRYRFVNAAYADWMKRSAAELPGKHVRDVLGEQVYISLRPYLERALSGEKVDFVRELTAHGASGYVREYYVPVMWDAGVQGVSVLLTDITDRRHAEQALVQSERQVEALFEERKQVERDLRVSEELLSKAFHASPDLISISRLSDGRFVDVNESFLRACGYRRDEVIGRTAVSLDLFDPDQRERVWAALAERQRVSDIEVAFRTRAGEQRFALLSAEIIEIDRAPHALVVSRDITQRKNAEDALRESLERFRMQYKGVPIPTYSWRKVRDDFMLVDFNDATEAFTQGLVANLLGKTSRELYPDMPEVLADLTQCFHERSIVKRENWFRLASTGEHRYLNMTHVFVPPNLVMVHVEDLSVRKQAEDAWRENEARLRDMINSNLIGIVLADFSGNVLEANDAFLQMTGYARSDFVQARMNWERITPPEYRGLDEHAMAEVRRGHTDKPYEKELLRADGARVPVLIGTSRAGSDDRAVAFVLDLTDRKRAEQRIHFQAYLLDVVEQGVIVTDARGLITYWNRFAEILYGWSAEEVTGRELATVIPLNLSREERGSIARLLSGESWSGEFVATRCNGTEFMASLTGTPIRDEKGDVIGVVAISADITERKKMEEDLIKVQKLESVGVLAGGIAHDFNNILTAILGNIALAKMYVDEGHRAAEVLSEAERAFWRARDLTQQLLTFAKGGAPIRKAGSLASVLLETPRFALTGSNVRLDCFLPADLWAANFDAGQISQVVNNIVINAKQAMPAGGIVQVSAANIEMSENAFSPLRSGRYVKITIADHGVGISADHLGKIFDPYFTTKRQGSGLGLATTYSIVQKHDGHIEVESEVGKGTAFHIYLPAVDGCVPTVEAEAACPLAGVGRVLLMDDEASIREVAGRLLTGLGYEVVPARNGAEAIDHYRAAHARNEPFAAVILDLTVPDGMGGRDCLEALRRIDPQVRAIVSSGYCNDPVMAEFERFGFKGVVAKPYQLLELSRTLHSVIRARND